MSPRGYVPLVVLPAKKQHVFDRSDLRLTVDEPEDLQVIRSVVDFFHGSSDFHGRGFRPFKAQPLYSNQMQVFDEMKEQL